MKLIQCPQCQAKIPAATTICPKCMNSPAMIERAKLYLKAQQFEMENNKKKAVETYAAIVATNDSCAFGRISSLFAMHLLCVKVLKEQQQLEPAWLLQFCKTHVRRFPEEAFKSIFMLLALNVIAENIEAYQDFLRNDNNSRAQYYWNKLEQKNETSN